MCFGSFSAVPAYSHCVVPFDDLCGLVKLNGPCAALAVCLGVHVYMCNGGFASVELRE